MAPPLRIKINGPHFYNNLAIVKSCKGAKFDRPNKLWIVPHTHENLSKLVNIKSLRPRMERLLEDYEIDIEREILKTVVVPEEAFSLKEKYPFLLDFQCVGAHYATTLKKFLIADEVGCGKTVECMPYIDQALIDNKKVIILCPSSIARQWCSEIKRFINKDAMSIVGMPKQKRIDHFLGCDIVVTTYESFKNDIPELQKHINFNNYRIVADEASKFKNNQTKIYKQLFGISEELDGFIALSATPIENELANFFNIVSIINPAFMSRGEFERQYCEFGTGYVTEGAHGQIVKHQKCTGYKNLREFVSRITKIMIRRTQKDVTGLPEAIVQNRIIEMTPFQEKVACGIRDFYGDSLNIGCLIFLREVANDTGLLALSSSPLLSELYRAGKIPYPLQHSSNKLPECLDIVNEIGNHKIIIFTQFAQMAIRIGNMLIEKEYTARVLTGENSIEQRNDAVEAFKNNEFQILIATDIFGYGVNLQFCDYMINFDIPWNPAKLNQRIGRIRRHGSTNTKTVINLLSEDIDEKVYKILLGKQNLFDMVVDGKIIGDESIRKEILQKLVE